MVVPGLPERRYPTYIPRGSGRWSLREGSGRQDVGRCVRQNQPNINSVVSVDNMKTKAKQPVTCYRETACCDQRVGSAACLRKARSGTSGRRTASS
jgi:hypothetical protein